MIICLAILGNASCGALSGGGGTVSCKLAAQFECQDLVGQTALSIAARESSCPNSNHGVYSASACDRTGSIGGCYIDESAVTAGASIVTWYFAGAAPSGKALMTSADVMAECPAGFRAP